MYQVYVIVNKINGKMYVGYTERLLDVRLLRHFGDARAGSNCSLHKAIRKYGEDNFDIRMIETYQDEQSMIQGEIDWIAYFDTYRSSYGYNDTAGGEGGATNSGKKFDNDWVVGISKSLAGKPQADRRRFSEEEELEICRLYVEEEKSAYALGQQFDCQRNLIVDILKRNHIEIKQSNYTGHTNGRNLFTKEQELEICKLYEEGNVSRTALSKQFNCGKTTVRDILIRNNVKL